MIDLLSAFILQANADGGEKVFTYTQASPGAIYTRTGTTIEVTSTLGADVLWDIQVTYVI